MPHTNPTNVSSAVARLSIQLRNHRGEGALPNSKLAVLSTLSRGPSTPTAIAHEHRQHPQTLTPVIAELEEIGFVSRDVDPGDRRRIILTITDDGRTALNNDIMAREDWFNNAFTGLTDVEKHVLCAAADIMNHLSDLGTS